MDKDTNTEAPNLDRVNRIELIDESGRVYVNTKIANLEFSIQDHGRTLKIFFRRAVNSDVDS